MNKIKTCWAICALLAFGTLIQTSTASATPTCTITKQTTPTYANGKVSWQWGVSCPVGSGSYTVYTATYNVQTGTAVGVTGTGSPFPDGTASGATQTDTMTCIAGDTYKDKVTVRSSLGLLAGPTYTTPVTLCGGPPPPPTTPTNLSATPTSSTSVALSWQESDPNATFDIYRDGTQVGTSTTTSFTDGGLQPSTTYSYTVDAVDGTTTPQTAPVSATTPASGGGSTIKHVVIILEENHDSSAVTGGQMPYLNSLGSTYAHDYTSYNPQFHPSLPNYMALTDGNGAPYSGTDCGSSTTGCTTTADNIFHQSEVKNIGWREWAEGMPTNCAHSNGGNNYVVHHAPPPFYTDLANCAVSDLPLVKTAVPAITTGFTFITPNNLDNAHSASLGAADNWLKVVMPQLMADPNYQNGSTLIEVTFDEDDPGTLIFINPALSHKVLNGSGWQDNSLLRLNEELLSLPLLAGAATAPDIRPSLGL